MAIIRKAIFGLFLLVGALLIIATLGSLIYNSSLWFLQVLNFPRAQVLLALLLYLTVYLLLISKKTPTEWGFVAALVVSIGLQAYILFPYTPLAARGVASATEATVTKESVVSLVVANVWIKNRQADKLLRIVADKDPTFVLAMEVNAWWVKHLDGLVKSHPYTLTFPTDNAYGMALYSKLPLNKSQVMFLNHDRVPSFRVDITLPDGRPFQLYTLHPVAPAPGPYPTNIGGKEVALRKAARLIARHPLPTVVAGDFNDVGWSHNMTQFAAASGLQDVRYGRGLYSTFDARSPLVRWPLDYVFVSHEFRVLAIEQLPKFGSDHFPYYVQLALQP